ncbi:MAG: aldehyde dehydrogenase family protein [Actinomycetes bacterium]
MTSPPGGEPGLSGASPGDVSALVARLGATFRTGRTRPLAWRAEQLRGILRLLTAHEDELLAALAADLGKPPLEAYTTDVGFVKAEVDHALAHLGRWTRPERVPTPLLAQPGRAWVQREPLGVVLIIAPWNYPVQLTLGPLVGALAAGNCAVVKPSELAPATSAVLARRLPEHVDPAAVAVVEGGVPEASALLTERFDHILYTGNGRVARIVMAAAAAHLTPVTLELGGKSPVIVDRSAPVATAARRIAWGRYLNAGQTCIAPDYVLCHADRIDELTDAVGAAARAFYGSDPQTNPDYGRILNEHHVRRLVGYLSDGVIAFGGTHDATDRFLAPTALRDVPDDAPSMTEEIFGPVLPIRAVADVDEAVAFVNGREKPLALYVFTGNQGVARHVVDSTSSGSAVVNATLLQASVPGLPFGGVGASGTGAYHGHRGFSTFSHDKAVLRRAVRPDPDVAYPPSTRWKTRLVRRFL